MQVVHPHEQEQHVDLLQLRQQLQYLHHVVARVEAALAGVADPDVRTPARRTEALLEQMRPGLRVVEVERLGRAAAAELGATLTPRAHSELMNARMYADRNV